MSAVFMGLGFFLCGTVKELWHFYLFYLVASLGVGAATALPTSIVQKWFTEKKGLALGIAASGIGAGPLVAAPLAEYLISHYGWRASYFIIGGFVWIVLTIVALAMVDKPEDIGLRPLGEEKFNTSVHADRQKGQNPPGGEPCRQNMTGWTARGAMRTKAFFLLGLIWFLCAVPIHLIMIHIVPFAINEGIPKGIAAACLGFIGGASMVGRLLGGAFSDLVGLRKSLIIATFFTAAALLWLPAIKNIYMFSIFIVIYGFFYGARVPQIPGLIGKYFGNMNLTEIMGIFWAIAGIGAIVGSMAGGIIFDMTGSYVIAFLFAAFCFGSAGALALFLKPPQPVGACSMS